MDVPEHPDFADLAVLDEWDDDLDLDIPSSSQPPCQSQPDEWDDDLAADLAFADTPEGHAQEPQGSASQAANDSASQAANDYYVKKPGKGKGRGGGRPIGNRFVRALIKQHSQDLDLQRQAEVSSAQSSIEKARIVLAQKRADGKATSLVTTQDGKEVALQKSVQVELAKHGPIADMFSVGTHSLQQDMLGCVARAYSLRQPNDMDDSLIEHLRTTPLSTMSIKVLEQKTQQTKVGEKILAITGAVLELSYLMWGFFLSFLCRLCSRQDNGDPAVCEPLLLIVKLRYDETPTKVRVGDASIPTDLTEGELADIETLVKAVSVQQSTTRAKVFQSELSLGCLVKTTLDREDKSPYKWVFGRLPTPLQTLDDGSGLSIKTALSGILQRVPELERASGQFPLSLRHSCMDRYIANFKAEKLLTSEFPFLEPLPFTCDVHKLQSVVEAATSTFSYDVSGILSVGVGISPDLQCVKTLRQIIARLLANRLVIYYSAPPPENEIYRKQVLDLFLPVKKVFRPGKHYSVRQALQRRWVLSYFLNGNLQGTEVQHYCSYSCCKSPEETMRNMTIFVTAALCPHACPKFARSRWTNWIQSVEWCGLLAGFHNLLQDVVAIYVGGPTKTVSPANVEPRPAVPTEPQGALDAPNTLNTLSTRDEWDDMLDEDEDDSKQKDPPLAAADRGFRATNATDAEEQPNAEMVAAEPLEDEVKTAPNFDWQAFNQKQKGNAREWAQSMPYPRLVILRLLSGILMSLMYRFLALGGLQWEQ